MSAPPTQGHCSARSAPEVVGRDDGHALCPPSQCNGQIEHAAALAAPVGHPHAHRPRHAWDLELLPQLCYRLLQPVHILRLRWALHPRKTVEEFCSLDLAITIVEQLEQLLALFGLEVQQHPFLLHDRIGEGLLEFIPTQSATPIRIHEQKQVPQLRQVPLPLHGLFLQCMFMVALGAGHRILHDDSCNEVHEHKDRKRHVRVPIHPRPWHIPQDITHEVVKGVQCQNLYQGVHQVIQAAQQWHEFVDSSRILRAC
mmetsp:Transcript_102754/g.287993  ORF Transcript_102754/g.287993 Transcript_102754/m.287993 type:complete len:256 (-) Transcript_102754:876-1643(-)